MITDADRAYYAALIDSLAILRTRDVSGTTLPAVAVHGAPVEVLEVLAAATGTGVTVVRRDYHRASCSAHCPDAHEHVQSVTGRWSVTGVRATVVLHTVLPFLRVQAPTARELVDLGAAIGWKGNVVAHMRQLGWSIPELKAQPRARVAS